MARIVLAWGCCPYVQNAWQRVSPPPVQSDSIMSNLPEPPPSVTEKLTVKNVLQTICAGVFVLSNIINNVCIAVIFIYLGSTIPVLKPYADYVAVYMLGARTVCLVLVFFVGCYWCCLRLVAPKQAGSNISQWGSKLQASCKAFSPKNGKIGRAGRTYFAVVGVLNTFNGLGSALLSWKQPKFGVYHPMMGIIYLLCAAWSIRIAYVGRVPTLKGTRGEDMTLTVGNDDSQPESDEVTPPGEYKDDDTTTQ